MGDSVKSIGTRFLLPFALLALLFSVFAFRQVYEANRKHATELILRQAELALEFNLAIRSYAGEKIRPAMESLLGKDNFRPETMSTSYISRSVFEKVRQHFPDYIIRFSSDNPRNPVNRAGADELQVIAYFKENPAMTQRVQEMVIDGRHYLTHFKPRWIKEECLRCHGDPKEAPAELLRIYGPEGNFHRRAGDLAGLDMVAVPVEKLEKTLAANAHRSLLILSAGLILLFASIAAVFHFVVSRRLTGISGHFQRIASGEEEPAPVPISGSDEIADLGKAFNHLIAQVRSTRDTLESRVALRTAELEKANEELRREAEERHRTEEERRQLELRLGRAEKMEALGNLAGGVAHDLNNVLGILVGYSEMLLMNIAPESPLRNYANSIHHSGLRGAAIIQDLLTLARRGVAVAEVVNLNQLVREFLLTPEYEKICSHHPGVRFHAELADDLLHVKGSPVHLSKTVMNLLANAAEAIPLQGEVTVRTENRYLSAPVHGYDEVRGGDYAVLIVADTGKGINAQDLRKIFEPFYTKKVMGRSGTGLGLAVVWGTVQDHHGYIDVESKEGEGSAFTLYFPACREECSPLPQTPLESYRGRGESLLVVDDVPEQRELAVAMLERLGYQVRAAASGEEALEFLSRHQVDLLVLDMIMEPGMDGLETYRQALALHPGQKAIILSGYAETERVKEALALGSGSYVRKPYILERIGLAVRRELDRD